MDEIDFHYAMSDFLKGADWEAADREFQSPIAAYHAGHGHVRPRTDGLKARCGGPALCSECAREAAVVQRSPRRETLEQAVARRRAVLL